MTRWERIRSPTHCGGCGAQLEVGAPVLVHFAATQGRRPRRFLRCGACVGGVPPDLPTEIVYAEPRPALDFTRVGLLPLEFQLREPGEEG